MNMPKKRQSNFFQQVFFGVFFVRSGRIKVISR